MSHNTVTQKIGFCENIHESTAEQSLDADISLPDYCPEIRKILKCTVIPNVTAVSNNSGRITVDAAASVKIIYVGENGKTACYEQNYPLQKYIESSRITSDSAVKVNIKTDYANCRAVSSRRVDVRAMMTFVFRAVKKTDDSVLSAADGAGIQTRCEEMSVASFCGASERAFSLSEVIEFASDKPAVSQIINVSASAVLSEIKVINNKALLKGDCDIKIYYLSEDSSSIEFVEHSIPISQIIELDGLSDSCRTSIVLSVCSCEAIPKADSSGDMRLIDFNTSVNASVRAFEEIPLTLINDAYSTLYETKNTYKNAEFYAYNNEFDTVFTNKVILESIGVSVSRVNAVWVSDMKYTFTPKEDKCLITGTYLSNILYVDEENQAGIIQKTVDFDFSVKLNEKSEKIKCFGSVGAVSCACAVTGDSRLELKTELKASGMIYSEIRKKYISGIDIMQDNKIKNNCALTISFCDKDENIWNIAKKYNTTVDAIKEENGLASDVLENNRMLMIPSHNC